jgi:hypothetical protein
MTQKQKIAQLEIEIAGLTVRIAFLESRLFVSNPYNLYLPAQSTPVPGQPPQIDPWGGGTSPGVVINWGDLKTGQTS